MEGIIQFTDGSFVGKVSEFETKEKFFESVVNELGDLDVAEDDMPYTSDDIEVFHIRWFANPPEDLQFDSPDGCYAYCQPGRGAFEVFKLGGD